MPFPNEETPGGQWNVDMEQVDRPIDPWNVDEYNMEDDRLDKWFETITGNCPLDDVYVFTTTKIEGVQPLLREIESSKGCFDPFLVSLGPYHHGKPELAGGNEIKLEMTNQFVQDSGRTIQYLFKEMVEALEHPRSYYPCSKFMEPFHDDLEKFHQMMFVDGCFIIQFIDCYFRNPVRLSKIFHVTKFVLHDLFLLENQLPFDVLKALMKLRFTGGEPEGVKLMYDFIQEHFLAANSLRKNSTKKHGSESESESLGDDHLHLLDLLHSQLTECTSRKRRSTAASLPQLASDWSSFRSAKELGMIGIYFEPSPTRHFTDVKFLPGLCSSELRLPRITIDDSTGSLLLNLVAYEATPGFQNDQVVTSFVIFMNALIDNPEDVQELRVKGILNNALGSDQDVSKLFNEISTGLVSYSHAFTGVKSLIENHYRNYYRRMIGEWRHTHFSRPWTTLAFIWGFVTLIQAVIETTKFFASSRLTQLD
ncbi:hypothetical protein ACFE04_030703 [Oxalis oulophora]